MGFYTSPCGAIYAQLVGEALTQFVAEPGRRGAHEPALGCVQVRLGEPGSQGTAQQPFVLPGADLQPVGKRVDLLHQAMVHEGHAHLQRVGHGEAIAQGKDVVR